MSRPLYDSEPDAERRERPGEPASTIGIVDARVDERDERKTEHEPDQQTGGADDRTRKDLAGGHPAQAIDHPDMPRSSSRPPTPPTTYAMKAPRARPTTAGSLKAPLWLFPMESRRSRQRGPGTAGIPRRRSSAGHPTLDAHSRLQGYQPGPRIPFLSSTGYRRKRSEVRRATNSVKTLPDPESFNNTDRPKPPRPGLCRAVRPPNGPRPALRVGRPSPPTHADGGEQLVTRLDEVDLVNDLPVGPSLAPGVSLAVDATGVGVLDHEGRLVRRLQWDDIESARINRASDQDRSGETALAFDLFAVGRRFRFLAGGPALSPSFVEALPEEDGDLGSGDFWTRGRSRRSPAAGPRLPPARSMTTSPKRARDLGKPGTRSPATTPTPAGSELEVAGASADDPPDGPVPGVGRRGRTGWRGPTPSSPASPPAGQRPRPHRRPPPRRAPAAPGATRPRQPGRHGCGRRRRRRGRRAGRRAPAGARPGGERPAGQPHADPGLRQQRHRARAPGQGDDPPGARRRRRSRAPPSARTRSSGSPRTGRCPWASGFNLSELTTLGVLLGGRRHGRERGPQRLGLGRLPEPGPGQPDLGPQRTRPATASCSPPGRRRPGRARPADATIRRRRGGPGAAAHRAGRGEGPRRGEHRLRGLGAQRPEGPRPPDRHALHRHARRQPELAADDGHWSASSAGDPLGFYDIAGLAAVRRRLLRDGVPDGGSPCTAPKDMPSSGNTFSPPSTRVEYTAIVGPSEGDLRHPLLRLRLADLGPDARRQGHRATVAALLRPDRGAGRAGLLGRRHRHGVDLVQGEEAVGADRGSTTRRRWR